MSAVDEAARRVEFRLTYGMTTEPRPCRYGGIDGPELPNSYYHLRGERDGLRIRSETGSGDWEDPDHPDSPDPRVHLDRWFTVAVREAIHEALEWYWVDGKQYLNPHGLDEDTIHELSGEFAEKLLALRTEAAS